jgi:hypothetical protein
MEDQVEAITKADWTDEQCPDVEPADGAASGLHIDLWIRDQEVVDALLAHTEGRARDDFARTALRIGVLALNQAQGRIDAEVVRREGDRLITILEDKLSAHHTQVEARVTGTLSSYFNPQDGKFNERVERLIKQDGDLERLMRSQVDASINSLKQTLDQYVGEGSTLSRLLTPGESNQLLNAIGDAVNSLVTKERDLILSEFSLDNKDGALCRLVEEVATKNGALTGNVNDTVQRIIDEFSLDKEGSALNRLVNRVEQAQKQISAEFTLDSDGSAFSRIRRELLQVIEKLLNENNKFQQSVVAALDAMKARKAESLASTRHGGEFESAAFSFIEHASQGAGDILDRTGEKPGKIKYCKVGDCVITLGPDCDAAGACIVFEMKEDASYGLKKSLEELATARANRDASVGVFIHSRRTAPSGLKPLARYGTDVVVVWDAEDEQSDVYLDGAIMIAKALALRAKTIWKASPVDVDALDKAIREIERQAGFLDEIKTKSGTIKSCAENILARTEQMRGALVNQIVTLDQQALALREFVGKGSAFQASSAPAIEIDSVA